MRLVSGILAEKQMVSCDKITVTYGMA